MQVSQTSSAIVGLDGQGHDVDQPLQPELAQHARILDDVEHGPGANHLPAFQNNDTIRQVKDLLLELARRKADADRKRAAEAERGQALEAYAVCRKTLETELRVEPEPETEPEAGSASGEKNGFCRIAAGKQISFMPGR